MTDIVERLRNLECVEEDPAVIELYKTAADEIERLRVEIEMWKRRFAEARVGGHD